MPEQPLKALVIGAGTPAGRLSALALAGAGCDVAVAAGSIDVPVYLRSAAKPFIAATVIQAGARERFGLTAQEIAVMAASHSGQPFHIAAVRSILASNADPANVTQLKVLFERLAEHTLARSEAMVRPSRDERREWIKTALNF